MTLGQGWDMLLGWGQQLCEILSRSNLGVRSYGPDKKFSYVCTVTLALKLLPWVKVMTHPWYIHGGVTCHDFGYGCAAGVHEPHPIHIPGQVKNMTHSYTSHIENWPHSYTIFENWPHSYTIFQILPIHILFGWKRYPIDILLMLKWYPFIYWEAWKVYPIPAAHLYIPL